MEKKKKQSKKSIILMVIFSIIIISLYFFMRSRTTPYMSESVSSKTEAEKLISKDITGNYPSTPKEVLKLYARITKCFYNEKLNEKQISDLAGQIRLLFDEELLTNNPFDDYVLDLKVDISDYQDADRTIMSYKVGENDEVKYWEKDGKNYASQIVTFTLKEGSKYSKSYEEFIFRQDLQNQWKIMGWNLTEDPEAD
jgi:hypothetical protein